VPAAQAYFGTKSASEMAQRADLTVKDVFELECRVELALANRSRRGRGEPRCALPVMNVVGLAGLPLGSHMRRETMPPTWK